MRYRRWALTFSLVLLVVTGWRVREVRAFTVTGPSEAPTLLYGDRVLVDRSARGPRRGELVLFAVPNRPAGTLGLKRVVAVGGDVVRLRENQLEVNGEVLPHAPAEGFDRAAVAGDNDLGAQIVEEQAAGSRDTITFTPGRSSLADYGPVRVPAGAYFLLGDNRDNSNDSRAFGPLFAAGVQGTVVARLPAFLAAR